MVQQLSDNEDLEIVEEGKNESTSAKASSTVASGSYSPVTGGSTYGGNQSFIHSPSASIVGSSNFTSSRNYDALSSYNTKKPGVVGLNNIGNTCFMNSALQCLLNTPALVEFFLKRETFSAPSVKYNQFALLNQFRNLVHEAWVGQQSTIHLSELKSCLASLHSQFSDYRQHDCQEFLAVFVDEVHEQLKKWNSARRTSTATKYPLSIKALPSPSGVGNSCPPLQLTEVNGSLPSPPQSKGSICSGSEGDEATPTKMRIQPDTPKERHFKVAAYIRSPQTFKSKSPKRRMHPTDLPNKFKNQLFKVKGATLSMTMPSFAPTKTSKGSCSRSTSPTSSPLSHRRTLSLKRSSFSGDRENRKKQKRNDPESSDFMKRHKYEVSPRVSETKRKLDFTSDDTVASDVSSNEDGRSIGGEVSNGLMEVDQLASPEDEPAKSPYTIAHDCEDSRKAREFWNQHIERNNTVIAHSLEGLLKSTVICSTCNYKSVTYEPFMYLTLPFPRVLERELEVHVVTMNDRRIRTFVIVVSVADTVYKVKQEVAKRLVHEGYFEYSADKLVFSEVYNYNVQRILDNSLTVRKLNDNRNMYVYALNDNFDERCNVDASVEQDVFGFSSNFITSDAIGTVSSTTGSNVNSYLEDWSSKCNTGDPSLQHDEGFIGPCSEGGYSGFQEPCESELPSSTCLVDGDPLDNQAVVNLSSSAATPGLSREAFWDAGSSKCRSSGDGTSETEDSGVGSGASDSTECSSAGDSVGSAKDLNFIENDLTTPEVDPDGVDKIDGEDDDLPRGKLGTPSFQNADGSSDCELLPSDAGPVQRMDCGEENVDVNMVTDWKETSDENNAARNMLKCIICLEETPISDMRQHTSCGCQLCEGCVKNTIIHFTPPDDYTKAESHNKLKCPACMNIVEKSDFVPCRSDDGEIVEKVTAEKISIIFRNDTTSGDTNSYVLFGAPWLAKLPSSIPAKDFYDYMRAINPFPLEPFKVLNVSMDGESCSNCPYSSGCHGCEIRQDGWLSFKSRQTVAIVFTDLRSECIYSIQPNDMAIEENTFGSPHWNTYTEPNYDIHDCLRAFSEVEHLDEQNPWYCTSCKASRCATKAISVCHFPDFLVIYLKRFVFVDHASNKLNNKVRFPIEGLDLKEYIAEEFGGQDWTYNLYACICHFGSVSSGHYTSFGKNPVTGEWHYFNDETVSEQRPEGVEHSSAYVLFYSKEGVTHDIPNSIQRHSRRTSSSSENKSSAKLNISSTEENWEIDDQEGVSSTSEYVKDVRPDNCEDSDISVITVDEEPIPSSQLIKRPVRDRSPVGSDDNNDDVDLSVDAVNAFHKKRNGY